MPGERKYRTRPFRFSCLMGTETSPAPPARQWHLLRSRRFAPLFVTQFLGAFNDNVYRFALIIFVTFQLADRSGADSRMLVVLTGGIFILPFLLFSAVAGQIADKFEKSALIRQIKSAEILVMGLGATAFWLESYPFLLVVLFLMGTQSTFFGPLKYAMLPQHLNNDELTGANGLMQMGTYVAILTGGMAGGFLAGLTGEHPWIVILTVMLLAVAGRWASSGIPPALPSDAALAIDFNLVRSSWTIAKAGLGNSSTATIVLLISGFWFTGATYLSVVPSYGRALLNADEQSVTLLSAAFTIGIGCGALLCERLSRGRIDLGLVPPAALLISLASFDVWLTSPQAPSEAVLGLSTFLSLPAAVRFFTDLCLIGFGGALYIVPLYASLQARAESRHRARVLAALNIVSALFMVLSAGFTMGLFALGAAIPDVFGAVACLNLLALGAAMAALPELGSRLRRFFHRH